MKPALQALSQTFTVPGTPGNFAPEHLTFFGNAAHGAEIIEGLSLLVTAAAAAGALAELFVLPLGSDPTVDADWLSATSLGVDLAVSATGFVAPGIAVNWPAVQVRVKSAGTSGSVTIHGASW